MKYIKLFESYSNEDKLEFCKKVSKAFKLKFVESEDLYFKGYILTTSNIKDVTIKIEYDFDNLFVWYYNVSDECYGYTNDILLECIFCESIIFSKYISKDDVVENICKNYPDFLYLYDKYRVKISEKIKEKYDYLKNELF